MPKVAAGKVKQQAPAYPVPQDADDVARAILDIGEHQRVIARLEAEANDRLAQLKAEYELQAAPYREQIKELAAGVQTYCDARREELTGGKVKFAKFASGEVNWRTNPPKVVTKRGIGIDTIIELLKARGLQRLIRTKEELAKDLILAEPEAVAGMRELSIEQSETFCITPFETKLDFSVG